MNKGEEIVERRDDIPMYGGAVDNMNNVALMWTGYLAGRSVLTGADVAQMLALNKAYRFGQSPDYSDNIDDEQGYLGIARDCVGDDMIDAENPKEYREKKARREQLRREYRQPSGNPYANAERDQDRDDELEALRAKLAGADVGHPVGFTAEALGLHSVD